MVKRIDADVRLRLKGQKSAVKSKNPPEPLKKGLRRRICKVEAKLRSRKG